MIKCPTCKKEKAIIHPVFGVISGKRCQKEDEKVRLHPLPEFATINQSDRINQQRDVHGGDILQPWTPKGEINRDFVKYYPKKARDYFSQKKLEKL